ncbi:MAG: hypothetical protein EON56_05525 [Alphaproteobacteria bacterium]|nr:MAG: hypothetical protein EON56_05525 [Alphaproteobacteria bacterium]
MGKTPGLLLRYMASSALLGLNQPGLLRRLVLVAIKLAGKPWARPMRRELLLYLWRNEMKNYEPGPYGGRVALVLAEKQRSGVIAGDLGWGRLAPQVEIIPVQGNHFTLIEPPLLEANMSRISPLLGSSSAPAAEDKRAEAN